MKRYTIALLALALLFGVSNLVSAQGPSGDTQQNPGSGDIQQNPGNGDIQSNSGTFFLQNPLKVDSIGDLVVLAIDLLTYLAVIIAVLALIWVGLQFVLAQGNPERLKELKTWLLYIVIGVALIIGARVIVAVVINTLDNTGAVSPGVIQGANDALRNN